MVEVVTSLSQGRTAAAQCGLFTHKSVPVIFEPSCICEVLRHELLYLMLAINVQTYLAHRGGALLMWRKIVHMWNTKSQKGTGVGILIWG